MKRIERFLSLGANFAAVSGALAAALTAIWVFFYPADVAEKFVDFQKLMEDARADVGRIAQAAERGADASEATASNTAQLAAAIPNWVTFSGPPYTMHHLYHGPTTTVELINESPFPINLTMHHFVDGVLAEPQGIIIPSNESQVYQSKDDGELYLYCLKGTSPAFEGKTLYEMREYQGSKLAAQERSFSPISKCP